VAIHDYRANINQMIEKNSAGLALVVCHEIINGVVASNKPITYKKEEMINK
jgi:hypothetical protein